MIHRMLIRLQYLLLVSLFALLGAAPSAAHRAEKAGTCTTTVSEQQDPCMPSPARFCFATVCNGGEFAGLSGAGYEDPGPFQRRHALRCRSGFRRAAPGADLPGEDSRPDRGLLRLFAGTHPHLAFPARLPAAFPSKASDPYVRCGSVCCVTW